MLALGRGHDFHRRVTSDPLIELCGVSCRRRETGVETRVERISMVIEAGSVVILSGEIGSGKNLLLRVLGLLDAPDAGEVFFECQQTSQWEDDTRICFRSRRCGYVFAAPFLLRSFSTIENVAMPMFSVSQLTPVEAQKRTEELLEFAGLERWANERVLPPSVEQRVALARALANAPSVIFVENLDTLMEDGELEEFRRLLHAATERYGVAVVATAGPSMCILENERLLTVCEGRVYCEAGL